MTRNSDQMAFYVVQFLELPYEGIDDYVCIPYTWVIAGGTYRKDGRAVVAYPKDEDPFLTRDRAKRKERRSDEWQFYLATVKYRSNSYENAEYWIASRNDNRSLVEKIFADYLVQRETRRIPDTQPESTPNTNSRNSTQGHSSKLNDNPRKPLPRTLIKRPLLLEPKTQLDRKRLKLKEAAKSSSANTQTTSDKVINSVKMPAQLCDNGYGIEDLVQTRNAIDKKIRLRNMKRNLEQIPSNLMDKTGSSSARSVEEQVSVVAQTRSQDGLRVREMHPGSSKDQTGSLGEITINSPEIQHALKSYAESASKTPWASQTLPSSSYIPSTGQILTKPSNPLYQPNQQVSQRQPQIPKIRTSVSNEIQNEREMPTLQEVTKKVQPSVLSNLLKSIRLTLSATHNRNEQQTRLSGQSTEHDNRGLTSSPKNIVASVKSDKHQNVIDNTRQTGQCMVKPETSDSDAATDEGVSDHELSTYRAPVERINDSTSTENTSASSSADKPTAAQNSTSINPTTHVSSTLEQQMLVILFTQMHSTFRYTYNTLNTLRGSILDTAKTYKKLISTVKQFNLTQNSAGNESFSINLKPEVRQSPEERHTEVTASSSSSTQDQHSNDDANKPPKKKYKTPCFVLPPEYDPHDTKWTLKYHANVPRVAELIPQSGVYVSYGDLRYCQYASKDCKSLAELLLSEVFKRTALSVCLTITERAQASDNVGSNTRPELDDHACTALIYFVIDYGLKRGWNTNLQPILSTLHNKIREIRFKYGALVQCLKPEVRQSPEERHTEVTASTSSSTQDQHSNDDANKPPKKIYKSWPRFLPPEHDPHDTKWTLKYHAVMPGVVEFIHQSGVYVSYGDLKYCQHASKDCKSLAERLLSEVFNRTALSVCLTITERAQASDNVGSNTRLELDDHACTVLIYFVLKHGLKHGWNTDLQPILSTLHNKIREIRLKYGALVQC